MLLSIRAPGVTAFFAIFTSASCMRHQNARISEPRGVLGPITRRDRSSRSRPVVERVRDRSAGSALKRCTAERPRAASIRRLDLPGQSWSSDRRCAMDHCIRPTAEPEGYAPECWTVAIETKPGSKRIASTARGARRPRQFQRTGTSANIGAQRHVDPGGTRTCSIMRAKGFTSTLFPSMVARQPGTLVSRRRRTLGAVEVCDHLPGAGARMSDCDGGAGGVHAGQGPVWSQTDERGGRRARYSIEVLITQLANKDSALGPGTPDGSSKYRTP